MNKINKIYVKDIVSNRMERDLLYKLLDALAGCVLDYGGGQLASRRRAIITEILEQDYFKNENNEITDIHIDVLSLAVDDRLLAELPTKDALEKRLLLTLKENVRITREKFKKAFEKAYIEDYPEDEII